MTTTELDVSGITAIQGLSASHLERRRKYLTASDVPAVVGIDRYKSIGDVYLDKTGAFTHRESGEPAAIGTALEPGLLTLTEAALGVTLTRSGAWNTAGRLGATLDALVADDRRKIVQFKTTGRTDDWDDGPPPRVLVQVQAEIACADAELAYVAVLHPSFGPLCFRLFMVERDETTVGGIIDLAERFMGEYVDARIMPPNALPALDCLKRIVRVANKVVPVDPGAVTRYLEAKEARLVSDRLTKELKEYEENTLRAVLTEMGDAEAGECETGTLTFLETSRKGYTVQPTSYRSAKFIPRSLPSPAVAGPAGALTSEVSP